MLLVFAAVMLQAAAASAPAPDMIIQPDWVTLPSGAEFAVFYPPEALKNRIEGRATIRCRIDGKGGLSDCAVSDEDPPGAGFGDAALRMASLFRMRATSKGGVRTVGKFVSMPIRFKAPALPPSAPNPPATAGPITAPDWARKPSGEDIAQFYPPRAIRTALEGRATMHCAVTVEGSLTGCTAIDEDPAGEGFGEAILKMAPLFHMRAETKDGKPVAGGTINIPVRFTLPGGGTMNDIVITRPTFTDGAATLDCRAQREGVDNCRLVSEAPNDSGMGQIAMELVPQLHPKVDVPIRFQVRFVFKKGETPRP